MGGQSAIRGFTYQTIVSVIHSLTDHDWDFVKVEPDTPNDKVDIIWERGEQSKCKQIKSSQRNFNKGDILLWLEQMILDVPGAELYQLILIGPVATGTDAFINQVNKANDTAITTDLVKGHVDKIKIQVITFGLDFLESKVRDEISRFLSSKGYHLPHNTIDLIAGGLIYQFLNFSVLGTRVSRDEFTEDLLDWVKRNYRKDLGIETKRSKFAVSFYEQRTRTFPTTITPFKPNLNYEPLATDFFHKADEQYREAAKIKLPGRTSVPRTAGLAALAELTAHFNLTDADVPQFQKDLIREKMQEYFHTSIDEALFYVGDLKENLTYSFGPFNTGLRYSGTADEIKKRKAIAALYWELRTIAELQEFIKFINSCILLPSL